MPPIYPSFEKTWTSGWNHTHNSSYTLPYDAYIHVEMIGFLYATYGNLYYTPPNGKGLTWVADRYKQYSNIDDEHIGHWFAYVKKGSIITVTGAGDFAWRYTITPMT